MPWYCLAGTATWYGQFLFGNVSVTAPDSQLRRRLVRYLALILVPIGKRRPINRKRIPAVTIEARKNVVTVSIVPLVSDP